MKVLLAIDPSGVSQKVMAVVAERPWPSGTSFCVIHVVDPAGFGRFAGLIEDAERSAKTLVKTAADMVARSGHATTSEVLVGFPRKAIAEYAKEWGADFIMVGSHGHKALTRFLLGSVALAVLRSAHCSVEIARATPKDSPASSHAMKILLATDGSEGSQAAVKSLAARPWPSGSAVRIISAVQLLVPENQMSAASLSSVYPASLLEDVMNEARGRAQEAAADARKILLASGLKLSQSETMPIGDPPITILNQATEWGADLIVLGSHGWRGIDRMLMGSVSESVALHAHCSVEVIRA
jgi:nucleotide-binding universal stress UspA family protein